ncbi:MAG: NAD-dependent epimerase/dehydratase family protein [Sedimenticola sp.]
MAQYLITGGCGFIGSHLVESLVADDHTVRVLDNLSTGKMSNLPDGCEVIIGDVADGDLVKEAMVDMEGCFHLAAVASVQQSVEDWAGTHRSNLTGSINVFDAARAALTPVVYASSAAVYGDNADVPLKENSAVRPLSAYGADKLGSELHARVASLMYGVPTTGMRFFNVYGPRQDPSSPYSGVISIFCDRIQKGEEITVFGDGEQSRDFIYVKDVVRFLRAAMINNSRYPQVFNVCTGKSVTINQLATTLMSLSGKRVSLNRAPQRQGDISTSVGDPHHSQHLLNVRAGHALSEGLRALLDASAFDEVEWQNHKAV